MQQHYPVLKEEAIGFLALKPDACVLDATTGLGGHTEAIAEKVTAGRVIACDRDQESLEKARARLERFGGRITFRQARFSELPDVLKELGIERLDGLLADFGASYPQLTEPERGMSFLADGPLDCRMDRSRGETAAELVNYLSQADLADLIYQLGGERRSRKLARAIVRARPIHSTRELATVIESVSPWSKKVRLHPATKTFMALRIAVNQELEEIDALLASVPQMVASGGRVVTISFHSDEDRRAKMAFRTLAQQGRARLLTKRVVRPGEEEIGTNPPSRSAKLRAVEMR
ncbi:MAG: 16S rRNA (cytosine(1402)-N(4))-methyltransferase RsmH [bacterium]|nr:16S rRNA (cytosine(1402)-N(4))-methyltransferase RsmH [bacterium]